MESVFFYLLHSSVMAIVVQGFSCLFVSFPLPFVSFPLPFFFVSPCSPVSFPPAFLFVPPAFLFVPPCSPVCCDFVATLSRVFAKETQPNERKKKIT